MQALDDSPFSRRPHQVWLHHVPSVNMLPDSTNGGTDKSKKHHLHRKITSLKSCNDNRPSPTQNMTSPEWPSRLPPLSNRCDKGPHLPKSPEYGRTAPALTVLSCSCILVLIIQTGLVASTITAPAANPAPRWCMGPNSAACVLPRKLFWMRQSDSSSSGNRGRHKDKHRSRHRPEFFPHMKANPKYSASYSTRLGERLSLRRAREPSNPAGKANLTILLAAKLAIRHETQRQSIEIIDCPIIHICI